jgi:hypothetical protein
MNKKIAIGLGIAGVVTASMGSVVYIEKSNLEKREQVLLAKISTLKSNLPSQYKFEKTQSVSNLFSSNGKYVFTSTAVDKSNNAQISLEYRASHGPSAWFGGDIEFVANGKVEGELVKAYQISNNKEAGATFKIEGLIAEDSSIESKITVNDYSFVIPVPVHVEAASDVEPAEGNSNAAVNAVAKTETPVKDAKTGLFVNVKGSSGVLNFNAKTGAFQTSSNLGSIMAHDLEEPKDKFVGTDLNVSYDANINNIDVGTFKFKAASLSNGTDAMKVEGVEFVIATEQKEQKYNMKLNAKIKNVSVMAQKGSFEIGYSINGIDKAMVDLSTKLGESYASRAELSQKEIDAAREVLLSNLKSGFSFNIDKVYLKSDSNELNYSGQFQIVPTPKDKEFSFQNQSKFGFTFKLAGDGVPMAYAAFSSFLGTQAPEAPKELTIKAQFENGALKINDKEAEQGMNDSILKGLKNIDVQLGFAKEEAVVEEIVDEEPSSHSVQGPIEPVVR